jgi:membrane protein implicated in regulation of membrane protease activity
MHCVYHSLARSQKGVNQVNRPLHLFVLSLAATGLLLCTASAEAYIGPGAGLSLFGALWALISAVVAALGFLVLWPLRRMRKRRLARQQAATITTQGFPMDQVAVHDTVPQAMNKTPQAPLA